MHLSRLTSALAVLCCVLIPWLGSHSATSCRTKNVLLVVEQWRQKPTIRLANQLVDSKVLLNQSPQAVEQLIGPSAVTIDPKLNPKDGKLEETRWHTAGKGQLVLTYVDGKLSSARVYVPTTSLPLHR